MKKILVGQFYERSNRGALGVFIKKDKTRVMEYSDGKCFLIGNDKQKQKLEKEFGKDYTLRDVTDEDKKLESKKLTEIR